MFKRGFKVVVISIGDRESKEFLNRAVVMYNELPGWIKSLGIFKLKTKNSHTLHFLNGSRINSLPSTSSAGRGFSVSWLVVDEAAFIEGMDKFWASIAPVLSTGGGAFLISTVNGVGGFYYDKWMGAVEGTNGINPIQIHYKEHPEYAKPEWEEEIRPKMTRKQWAQEYCCDFLGSGETFIDSDILGKLRDNIQDDYYTRYNNRLRIFKEVHPHHDYLIAVDPSLGRGRDYSAYHVIDLYNGEQVAEFYSNKFPLNELAKSIKQVGEEYNTAYVVCERNGIGRALIENLFYDLEYENLWMDEKDFGVQVTNHNRDQILGVLEEALREGWFKIKSERSVDELLTFIIDEKTGKLQADEGQHDDLVLAMSFAAWAVKKLGSNAALFVTNEIYDEDRYSIIAPISNNRPFQEDNHHEQIYGETKKESMEWLLS